jgi:hypothetical protein
MRQFIILFFAFFSSSCATILSGPKQTIQVITNEPGALVKVNHVLVDTTPCLIKLKRSLEPPSIVLSHPKYNKQEIELKPKWNEITALNTVFIPFWVVDYFAGTWIKYRPLDTIVLQNSSN